MLQPAWVIPPPSVRAGRLDPRLGPWLTGVAGASALPAGLRCLGVQREPDSTSLEDDREFGLEGVDAPEDDRADVVGGRGNILLFLAACGPFPFFSNALVFFACKRKSKYQDNSSKTKYKKM